MRRIAFVAFLSVITLLMASGVNATGFTAFEPAADCEGWSVYARLSVWELEYIDIQYEVYLYEGSTTVASFTGTERLYTVDTEYGLRAYLDLSVPWGLELCGDYTAEGSFSFDIGSASETKTFSISFTCECEEEEYCNFTPGYWKNHPESWPVTSLEIGGMTYTMAQLMDIFDLPTVKDMTIKLAHHLIAAKLNVLSGSYNDIQDAIDDADNFLTDHPIGSNPKGEDKDYAEDLKDMLEAYNEMGCGEEEEMALDANLLVPTLNASESAAVEEKSWGAIKDIYK